MRHAVEYDNGLDHGAGGAGSEARHPAVRDYAVGVKVELDETARRSQSLTLRPNPITRNRC